MPVPRPRSLSLNEAASYVADYCEVTIEKAKAALDRAFREYSLSVYSERFEKYQDWQGAEIDWDNSAVVGRGHGFLYRVRVSVFRQHLHKWVRETASRPRVEWEFQSPDWSLGNVLSWIAFGDPTLICQFEGLRAASSYGFYKHPRGFDPPAKRPMLVPNAAQTLLDALKDGRLTAIRNGAEIPSSYWFGRYITDLSDDLRFRRAEVIGCWPADSGEGTATSESCLIKSAATNEEPISPSGTRTNKAEAAEEACRQWLGSLSKRPASKDAAFAQAQAAVKEIGPLSRKAFDREWATSVPAGWKHAGRRKSPPPEI